VPGRTLGHNIVGAVTKRSENPKTGGLRYQLNCKSARTNLAFFS
jgi:hypothetical protein